MNKWAKKLTMLGLSVSLVGAAFTPSLTYGQSKTVVTKAALKLEQQEANWLKEKKKDEKERSFYSEDTLVIKYNKPLTVSDHKKAGTTVVRHVAALKYVVVKLNRNTEMNEAIAAYGKSANVLSVGPSALLTTLGTVDPKVKQSYHLSLLQIEKAQKLAGKNAVTVAVVDTGMDSKHPELSGNLLPSYNTVVPLNQGLPDYHGTHVAGIIASKKDNGIGSYGINPNAKILPVDVFNRGWGASDYHIAEGILHAIEKGAKVINMSLGGPGKLPIVEDAIKLALSKNITVIAAAGNNGDDMNMYPASIEGVISVGSTNKDNKLSSYSSYGSSIDIVAPGENVYAPIYDYDRDISFDYLSGTSMASPVVAGVVSLLLSKHPKLTPAEVEYILKHSTKDLGEKGYDTKYGHGLINPVAVLSYDIKKIPASIKAPKTEKEILAQAKNVEFSENKFVNEGKITKANETHWFKMNVKKGEFYQTSLMGSKKYDYQFKLHLYSSKDELETVNEVKEGKTEGRLIEIPRDGVLVVGVKDSNNHYDDSGKGLSNYKLSIEKADGVKEDGNDLQNVTEVTTTPFKLDGLTFTGKDGDDDFFKINVEDPKMIKIKTTAVPGIDQTIKVYPADQLLLPPSPEGEQATVDLEKIMENPMFIGSSFGVSEGEELIFDAMPQMEYMIVVSNKKNPYYYDYYSMMYGNADVKVAPSLAPYTIDIVSREIPADEDGWPNNGPSPEEKLEDGTIATKEYAEIKKAQTPNIGKLDEAKKELTEEEKWMKQVMELALPYEIGSKAEAFLQSRGDEDWYKLSPSKTGIYQFNLTGEESDMPAMQILKVSEYKDEKGNKYSYFEHVGNNADYGWYGDKVNEKFYVGLKENEHYYLVVSPVYGKLPYNNYSFNSKLVLENTQDQHEDNDTFEKAKEIKSGSIHANFAMSNDQDIYYYKSKAKELVGISIGQEKLSSAKASKYPKELQGQIFTYAMVVEDTNKNKKLDNEEANNVMFIEQGIMTGKTTGAFNAKKGKNYFIVASGFVDHPSRLSLNPYNLTIKPAMKKDEDAGNLVKKNTPSKPLKLKKVNSKKWQGTGYLNPGVPYGDEDWYVLELDKSRKVKFTLTASGEIDGVISVYQNGKNLKTSNYYRSGDAEVMTLSLKKGKYYIKIKDEFGNASINPYTLTIE
ncbi:S8 family serine peptidase [Bacillus sp. 31A1R]|uniref:S8 family serine peptidase n=1 Tax=Robertmurraya mangrovi TaxID=3098077 RepID=A0ABU5IXT1_9BACI|nr:S8 family serine peptidase [Bacillus sp. 31A1R]MDZ5471910.1 S8 family serine peptidase [Bacillus sp. 31A1R]